MEAPKYLPWAISAEREPNMVKIVAADGGWLGQAAVFGDTDEEAQSTAEYVVAAVNAHDELVTMVQEFVWHIDNGGAISDAYDAAKRLLAELKGE